MKENESFERGQSPEEAETAEIVVHNIGLMKTEMIDLLRGESLRGYEEGGKWYSAAGANFHFERSSGRILAFGLLEDLPPEITEDPENINGLFRVAMTVDLRRVDPKLLHRLSIYKIVHLDVSKGATERAVAVLRRAMGEWNENIYGARGGQE